MSFKSALFVVSLLFAQAAHAADTQVYEARIVQITRTEVTVEGLGTFPLDHEVLQCFDFRKERTTCQTLAGVGYADKARITFVGSSVRRIELIELQQ